MTCSAAGPRAANEACGCALRRAPGQVRTISGIMPIPRAGVTAGSKAGMCSRITGHHDSGTGGAPQPAGSELPPVWVGTTSVPSGPSASRSAATTAGPPPTTQPSAESDECTSSTPPGRTPSARSPAAISGRVTGAPLAAIARSSPLMRAHPASRGGVTTRRRG